LKRGMMSFNIVSWVLRILFVLAGLLAVVLLVRMYQIDSVDIKDIHAEIVKNRVLYAPSGVMHADMETGRSYPGLLDPARFNDSVLSGTINYGTKSRTLSAKLYYSDNQGVLREAYTNKTWYRRWEPAVGVAGPGGAVEYMYRLPVVVLNETSGDYPTTLYISVIIPNS